MKNFDLKVNIQKISQPKPLPFLDESLDLGFGKYFSDHFFISTYNADKGWHNSEILPYGHMAMSPAASVFHYGQSLFEGLKAFRRTDGTVWLFRPEFNWKRMCDGASRLCMPAPSEVVFLGGLKKLLEVDEKWVPSKAGTSLYIRPTLIGTEGFLGVRPSKEAQFFTILSPVGSYYSEGPKPVKIWVEDEAVRAAPGGLGATKAGANYAASLQAGLKAKSKGYSQVLWLDVHHEGIEEVGTMNVFFVFKDEIVTPALNGSILAGGVRDSILTMLRHTHLGQGRKISERRITMSELLEKHKSGDLQEAFGTGTAAVISPIGELCFKNENYHICKDRGPVSTALYDALQGIQMGTQPDQFGWMVQV